MRQYFKLEFKKALFSRRTLIFIFIIVALFIIPYLEDVVVFNSELRSMINPYPGEDGIDCYIRISQFSYIGFIGPIIAGLLYSTSVIKDKESGFMDKLLELIDIKTYFKVKLAVNTLLTSIVFAVGQGIIILYLTISFGVNNALIKDFNMGAFASLYNFSKIGYISLMLLIVTFSSAAFSTFIFAITTAMEKKFIAYIFPAFYVIMTGIFFEMWCLNSVVDFNVTKLFNLIMSYTTKGFTVILYDSILILTGLFILYKFEYKKVLKVINLI